MRSDSVFNGGRYDADFDFSQELLLGVRRSFAPDNRI